MLHSGVKLAATAAGASIWPISQASAQLSEAQPFDFAILRKTARELAAKSYVAPKNPAADIIAKIDFDVAQKIKFRAENALWGEGPGLYPVRLFHVDKFNPLPVQLNMLSGGMARRVLYSQQAFDYGDSEIGHKLPSDLGFSGFRVMDGPGKETDWLAFQGASYFRSSGEENQYGGSARGIAVNTTASSKEEFPRFVEFWLAEPERSQPAITVYALLDGPSLTGAYRFVATKKTGAIMDVEAELNFRSDIAQLGIAPLTSMYWYGENQRPNVPDWRPEIHDNDGLALWTGKGERIWRPLMNPPSVRTNSFIDENPKGFGLLQRDRDFANYQDDGAFYDKRPTMWVEPRGNWEAGAVQLVEIPTQDEIHDNIVAYWMPKRPIKAREQMSVAYRLYWQNDEPDPPTDVARVIATRIGRGGVPGHPAPDDKDSWKFAIDYIGGPFADMKQRYDIKPTVTLSRGKVVNPYSIKVVGTKHWRAIFDVLAPGKEQIDLRCFLQLDGKALTETWLYQFFPQVA